MVLFEGEACSILLVNFANVVGKLGPYGFYRNVWTMLEDGCQESSRSVRRI
jgi:hypothetical protein